MLSWSVLQLIGHNVLRYSTLSHAWNRVSCAEYPAL